MSTTAQLPHPTLNTTAASTSSTTTPSTTDKDPATSKQQQDTPSPTDSKVDPAAAAFARAMSHTGQWKPRDRRQSWDAQEQKHEQHEQYMGQPKGEGFSEA
jgi:hypothetical protein